MHWEMSALIFTIYRNARSCFNLCIKTAQNVFTHMVDIIIFRNNITFGQQTHIPTDCLQTFL